MLQIMSFTTSHMLILSLLFDTISSLSSKYNFLVSLTKTTPHLLDTNCISGGKNFVSHSMRFNDVYDIKVAIFPKGVNTVVSYITVHIPNGNKHGKFKQFYLMRDVGKCQNNICQLSVQDDGVCFMLDEYCEL